MAKGLSFEFLVSSQKKPNADLFQLKIQNQN